MNKNIYNYIKENIINEVRLPNGYFKVINAFSLEGEDKWDITFIENQFINIDTENKKINIWNNTLDKWVKAGIEYNELMKSNNYSIFKINTIRIDVTKLPKNASSLIDNDNTFTTTVKSFNKKANEEGLEPNDKVSVRPL